MRLAKRTKNKMSNKLPKRALDISENETEFSKKIKLEHKLISVTVINIQKLTLTTMKYKSFC